MINIQLQDEVAAALVSQARAEGLSLEAYLERLVTSCAAASPRMPADELERMLDEAAVDGPEPVSTYARADIYLDHD
jgi:hypothetical protein